MALRSRDMNLYVAVIIAYAALQVGLGLVLGRRVKTSGDFFVASRRLGPGLLFSTLIAANIGAGSTVGAAGLAYRDGVAAWWWVGSAGLGSLFLAFLIGPRIHRIAAERDFRTVGDYLEYRYSRSVRGAIATMIWLGTLSILAGQLIAISLVLDVIAGVPKPIGCLIGGVVMTTYFAAGGLLGSAWVNTLQLVVEGVGFILLAILALDAVGGWESVRTSVSAGADYWSFWGSGASGLRYVALLAPAFVISPGLIQKVYGARDGRTVRLGVAWNAAALLGFAAIPVILGVVARALHPDLPTQELALPTVLRHDLPPLVGALGLAALFSTEVNTAEAILFMLSTSLSQDLYKGYVNRAASDRQVLVVARLAAVAGGTLGVGLAIAAASVIGALSIFYSLLTVSLFVPVVAGLYLRRPGTPEAAAAIGAGISTLLAVELSTGGRGFGSLSPVLLGLLAAVAGFTVVGVARFLNSRRSTT